MATHYESSEEETATTVSAPTSTDESTQDGESSPEVRRSEEEQVAPIGIRRCRCKFCGILISTTTEKFLAHVKYCRGKQKKKSLKQRETMPRNKTRRGKGQKRQ